MFCVLCKFSYIHLVLKTALQGRDYYYISILQIRELKHRKAEWLAQSHTEVPSSTVEIHTQTVWFLTLMLPSAPQTIVLQHLLCASFPSKHFAQVNTFEVASHDKDSGR